MLLQDPLDHAHVFEAFGLPLEAEAVVPLYPFAPVFLLELDGVPLVLKRTSPPFERALGLAEWERSLAERGVAVVEPVPGFEQNPLEVGSEVWVVYPYVEGEPYEASLTQLRSAGALLGRMHAIDEPAPGLKPITWEERSPEELEGELLDLSELSLRHSSEEAEAIVDIAADWLAAQNERSMWLASQDLPEADCSWDYKANNLVFTSEGPVLIDPDLGGRLPRVLDLALACLLFHNEIAGGEGRLLSTEEWEAFLEGYFEHVTLTEAEEAAWPEALRYMFVEEGLWLVFNEYEIDAPLQQDFMDDLLAFVLSPERYPLQAPV